MRVRLKKTGELRAPGLQAKMEKGLPKFVKAFLWKNLTGGNQKAEKYHKEP